MHAALDPERVRVVAQIRHSEACTREDTQYHADPLSVGRVAAKLAQRYYYGDVSSVASSQIRQVECAGMLVYAMERWGYNFEELCDVSEFAVASIVSGLSPDVRLPPGRRIGFHCSSLSQADAPSQIVKLAEIIAACEHILAAYTPHDLAMHAQYLKVWGDENYKLVGAMSHLRDNGKMKKIVAETREKLMGIVRVADEAKHPRKPATVTATPI